METGEILTDDVVLDVPPVPEEEWVEPEIILPQSEHEFPNQEETFDDEDVQVDFFSQEALEYKLPSLQLFAPDKPKDQSKEKENRSREYQDFGRNLCKFWYQGNG